MSLLTKNAFLAALDCPAKGWHARHQDRELPSWERRWQFFQGQEVHRLAAEWVGPGILVRRTPFEEAVEDTRRAVAERRADLLYEASFAAAGCGARADILRWDGHGWLVGEVKSGQSPKPGESAKDEYLADLAYTVMVATGAGLPVRGARLILLNRDHALAMPDRGRFVELDVSAEVFPLAADFARRAETLVAQVTADHPPPATLIEACTSCDSFAELCLGREIPDPIFLIPHLRGRRFASLAPYRRLSALPSGVDLTEAQHEALVVLRADGPVVDRRTLAELDALEWPARYLDFETAMPALPWHEGDTPYTTIPTQFSVHRLETPGGAPSHTEHLADLDGDGRRLLTERLLEALGDRGSIVTYSGYEQSRLKELAARFPDLRGDLERILTRLFDLEPFFKRAYRHPAFRGRTSIKNVLPVLVPDLSYAQLAVGNGGDAAGLFALMKRGQIPEAEHPRHRQDLLDYCRLDTLAMVRLHEALRGVLGR